MVNYTYEPTTHTHVRVKADNGRSSVALQNWWESIMPDCDAFFEISATFSFKTHPQQLAQMLMELERLCSKVEMSPYPQMATEARMTLLSAMSNVLIGFTAALRQDHPTAAQHTEKARRQLERFSNQLDALGVD